MFPCPVGTYPKGIKGDPQPWVAGCNSKIAHQSNTPMLQYSITRVVGFEHEHEDEDGTKRRTPNALASEYTPIG